MWQLHYQAQSSEKIVFADCARLIDPVILASYVHTG